MYIGIDLGSTNIKAALYDGEMKLISRKSFPVSYIREHGFVEFDAKEYVNNLIKLLSEILKENKIKSVNEMAFTGQAESLVVLGDDGNPLMNAISWMDERSVEECDELSKLFSKEECESVTGQQAVLPTWPATKILWLKKNKSEVYENAKTYMLLKDYVIFALTGKKVSDMSIATFSFYFDIYKKCYWKKMTEAIGISEKQLPPLVEPCSVAGCLKADVAEKLGITETTKINVGTLDHFAGMIGTGNIKMGKITLSTGTVMAMATFSKEPCDDIKGIAMHYGFLPDTHIMLPVAESGGVSLEWFKNTCMKNFSFREIDEEIKKRERNSLLFLPYLVGTNSPEFDSRATGVFWGLRQEHDAYDMAYAVMEGVGFLLKKNLQYIRENGTKIDAIIATGGGSKSDLWCQLQADITGYPIMVPKEKEAACLGAAIIASISDGKIKSLDDAAESIEFEKVYTPKHDRVLDEKYEKFNALYDFSCALKDGGNKNE
ncbi:MAG: hypothetical protein IKL74_05105 [Clostridia bacterium]|nr:hypothetical protein [Clostridia bacterium]